MVVKKQQKNLLRTILIIIVRSVLSVRAIRSTRGNSTRRRLKKPVKKAEVEVNDRKPENLLANYPLEFEPVGEPTPTKVKRKRRVLKNVKRNKKNS